MIIVFFFVNPKAFVWLKNFHNDTIVNPRENKKLDKEMGKLAS